MSLEMWIPFVHIGCVVLVSLETGQLTGQAGNAPEQLECLSLGVFSF